MHHRALERMESEISQVHDAVARPCDSVRTPAEAILARAARRHRSVLDVHGQDRPRGSSKAGEVVRHGKPGCLDREHAGSFQMMFLCVVYL